MRQSRLHNKVAGSEWTLPFCIVAATAMWWLPQQAFSVRCMLGLALCLLTTSIVMETNARQHIIRIRTRMMSCVWIVLAASLAFMHPLGEPLVAAALLLTSYHLLFRCYQRHRPQLDVFHAFLMLGIGSFCAPVMLLMAVPYFLYIGIFLRALTKRAFWAGLIGLAVPYWCYAVWCQTISHTEMHLKAHFTFTLYKDFPEWQEAWLSMSLAAQVTAAVVCLLSIVGIVHYLRTNYDDKIRVRMFLYIYVSQTLLLMAFLWLQPAHYQTTMALLTASASPLIAHHFALSRGISGTVFFLLSLLLTAGMATLNLWPGFATLL